MGTQAKTQQLANLTPSRRSNELMQGVVLGFIAVLAVSFGPGWMIPVVVVAYAAAVL